jgi:hypothetical protein
LRGAPCSPVNRQSQPRGLTSAVGVVISASRRELLRALPPEVIAKLDQKELNTGIASGSTKRSEDWVAVTSSARIVVHSFQAAVDVEQPPEQNRFERRFSMFDKI